MILNRFPPARGRAPVVTGTFEPIIPPEREAKSEWTGRVDPSEGRGFRQERKGLLVCFSHLRWDFVWQRPQHLLSRAAEKYRVVVFEEPVFEQRDAPALSLSSRPGGVEIAVPLLPQGCSATDAVAAQRELVQSFLDQTGSTDRTFWYYTPMAMAFSGRMHRDLTIYDNMDELSCFRGASPELMKWEQELLRQADAVFTGGLSLFEAKRDRHANVHAFPSSIDAEHFATARHRRQSLGKGAKNSGHPRLGFFGVIDERLDLDLLAAAADLRPEWQFIMIGPVVKIDPADLPRRANIRWGGACAYADLPEQLATWDVGLMPFALNEATRFISPTKTPEFLAAGVQVVSTPIADVVRSYGRKGLVEIATTASDFVAAAERLMARPKLPWLLAVDQELAANSWDRTWAEMYGLMRQARRARRTATASRADLEWADRADSQNPRYRSQGETKADPVCASEPSAHV